jgi:class 3 adenylate cyclase
VSGTGEGTEMATVIAVTLSNQDQASADDDEQGEFISKQALLADQLANQHGVERVRAGADRYLFLAGLGSVSDGGDMAVAFVSSLAERQSELAADEDVSIALQVGLATGPVATGLLARGSLAFNAWGEPVRQALALSALAGPAEVLVGASTGQTLTHGRWTLDPAEDLLDLDGKQMQALRLVPETNTQPSDDQV